jgi:predicted phage baseplate assembly protein
VPLPTPILDDRRHADLVAEAKSLIPVYTPEWTDLNESDPGITLVELFAWLSDLLLFRLNQVPELHYVKFLELLGLQLRPAQPARTDLSFALTDPPPAAIVPVPRGTRVAAAGGEGQPPVVFETDRSLQALGAKLASVQSFDGFSYTLVTAANDAGDRGFDPFGPQARSGSALCLGFALDGEFPTLALDLAVFAVVAATVEGVHCDLAEREIAPPAQITWEYWNGSRWDPLGVDRDETRAFTRTGYVSVQVPGERLRKLALGETPEPLYWLRARVSRSGYERAPQVFGVTTNTVPATQAQTVENEVLGGSDGLPDQVFELFYKPVLAGSLVLEIDEGSGSREWTEVPDFNGSRPDDRHYVLDRASGMVLLPDGEHGRIPVVNAANPHGSIVARTYRYGGGGAGNLGLGTVTQLQSAVEGVDSVRNRQPAAGGADAETVDEAKLRATEWLQSGDRAVTARDFGALARETPGTVIARAEALALTHPSFPDVPVPGAVTVVVVPDAPGVAPLPNEATLKNVCAHLDKHRLITTEVFVVGPTYRDVRIETSVRVKGSADLGTVRGAIEAELTRYFHPLTGGEDGEGWPLGGTIFHSLVSREVLQADPGVARIAELWIVLDDEDRQPLCADVAIGPRELLRSDEHRIEVSYE